MSDLKERKIEPGFLIQEWDKYGVGIRLQQGASDIDIKVSLLSVEKPSEASHGGFGEHIRIQIDSLFTKIDDLDFESIYIMHFMDIEREYLLRMAKRLVVLLEDEKPNT